MHSDYISIYVCSGGVISYWYIIFMALMVQQAVGRIPLQLGLTRDTLASLDASLPRATLLNATLATIRDQWLRRDEAGGTASIAADVVKVCCGGLDVSVCVPSTSCAIHPTRHYSHCLSPTSILLDHTHDYAYVTTRHPCLFSSPLRCSGHKRSMKTGQCTLTLTKFQVLN